MSDADQHPILLPWYAAGTLDAWSVRQIDEHLEGCASCRLELEALVSTAATLRRHDGTDHLEIGALLELEQDDAGAQRHLAACEMCREDLETLRAARREIGIEPGPRPGVHPVAVGTPAGSRGWRTAFLAAAAAAVLLLVPASRGLRPAADLQAPRAIHSIRLMAQVRGNEGAAELAGAGPWVVEVVLPFGAPAGDYTLRVAPSGAPPSAGRIVLARATGEGILSILLPTLPSLGAYQITATPVDQPDTAYGYRFTRVEGRP